MFYTCMANCTDPTHQHKPRLVPATKKASSAKLSMPVKPATPKAVAKSANGSKSKVVDMHCHYLNPVVNAKTAHLNPGQYDMTTVFANELTLKTNVKQMSTRAPKLTGVTERLVDMDRMGVDIQAVCPAPYHFFYWTEPDYTRSQ
jgi:aminocarboxymuconate-semialdehyde decarboxylase